MCVEFTFSPLASLEKMIKFRNDDDDHDGISGPKVDLYFFQRSFPFFTDTYVLELPLLHNLFQ